MRTTTCYSSPADRSSPSGFPYEDSSPVLTGIRSALVARGSSFRGWVRAWAIASGRNPDAAYETARATISRRLERGLAPTGSIGIALVDALRADLGPIVVPYPKPAAAAPSTAAPAAAPAGGSPEHARRTSR